MAEQVFNDPTDRYAGALGTLNPSATATTNNAFQTAIGQYFGAQDGTTTNPSGLVNAYVPGYGPMSRIYSPDAPLALSNQDPSTFSTGEGGGLTGWNDISNAYKAGPESAKYTYENYLAPTQITGHRQTYSDDGKGGIATEGSDFDGRDSVFDKIWDGVITAALAAGVGGAGLGVAGALGGETAGATAGAATGAAGESASAVPGIFGTGASDAVTTTGALSGSAGGTGALASTVAPAVGDSTGAGISVIGKAATSALPSWLTPAVVKTLTAAGLGSLIPTMQGSPSSQANPNDNTDGNGGDPIQYDQSGNPLQGNPGSGIQTGSSVLSDLPQWAQNMLTPSNIAKIGTSGLSLLSSLLAKKPATSTGGTAGSLGAAGTGLSFNSAPAGSQLAGALTSLQNRGTRTYNPYTGNVAQLYMQGGGHNYFPTKGVTPGFAHGGEIGGALATLGQPAQGHVQGPGDGQSDSVPIHAADGEYVIDSDVVSALGNGSNKAGAEKLDEFRRNVREHKRSAPASSIPPVAKSITGYMR